MRFLLASFGVLLLASSCTQEFTNATGDNLFAGGKNLLETVAVNCTESDEAYFNRAVWPTLSTRCAACHEGAGKGDFAFPAGSQSGAMTAAQDYIDGYGRLFVDKPSLNGVSHGGQQQFSTQSDEALKFSEFILRTGQSAQSCPQIGGSTAAEAGFTDITNISAARTARKAAILMQGRLPTPAEIAQAQTSDNQLRSLLLAYMDGDVFDEWLMNSANDQLLTRKYIDGQENAVDALNDGPNYYVNLSANIDAAQDAYTLARDNCEAAGGTVDEDSPLAVCRDARAKLLVSREVREETHRALADEPLQLIRYVVNNNLPYSTILTADFMMMNPFTYEVLDGQGWSNYNALNEDDWRPGHIRQFTYPRNVRRADGSWESAGTLLEKTGRQYLPSAGILSSPVFQLRYPSTDTNRNRARARWTYYYFLGVDIERLAVRAMDPEELKTVTNPGAEGSSCYGCHVIMDPVAGAFQSWGNRSQYLIRNGMDSLPQTYVEGDDYLEGDQWFNGQLKPGFNSVDMPVVSDFGVAASHDDGLQWLAEQLVADARFASGTAKFWFPGLFGREALQAPTESTDADYDARMQAYLDEQELITTWAENFRSDNMNLRLLLVDMMMSPLFRGELLTSTDSYRLQALSETGLGRLLTPEQLDRKLTATTGYVWQYSWRDETRLNDDLYMFYGGIDSDQITERATELNSLMYSVVERMANEISCSLVAYDFWPGIAATLFTSVDIDTNPNSADGEAAIRATIDNLMWRLWGVQDADEQEALWQLYKALYDERIAMVEPPRFLAVNDNENDLLDEFCDIQDLNPNDSIVVQLNWSGIDWSDDASIRSHLGSYYNPEQTLRPWVSLLSVMLSDVQFVTE